MTAALVVFTTAGCSPPSSTSVVPASRLVNGYLDTPDLAHRTWTGRTVTVTLAAGNYSVTPDAVHWFTGFENTPPVIVFECERPPRDNTQTIRITGVCRGSFRDGKRRSPEIDFFVKVADCTTR